MMDDMDIENTRQNFLEYLDRGLTWDPMSFMSAKHYPQPLTVCTEETVIHMTANYGLQSTHTFLTECLG